MSARPLRMELEPGVFCVASADPALRVLLRERDRLHRELAQVDAQLLPLRRRFADERGEKMLPTIERLRRELL